MLPWTAQIIGKDVERWSPRILIPVMSSEPSRVDVYMYNPFSSIFKIGKLLDAVL